MERCESMEKITIGKKFEGKFYFRETCFGIYEKDNKILLVKKDGQYSLVGGGIEDGESQEDCLKREFLEETGYEINGFSPLIAVDCFWLAAGKYPLESLANIYMVNIDENSKIEPLEKDIHEVEFVEKDKLLDLLPLPYQNEAIKFYLKSKTR